jgi:hypothetical protein
MSRARQVGSLLLMAGFLALTTATSKPKRSTPDADADGASAAPAPTGASAAPKTTSPADLEPLAVLVSLGCRAKPGNVGCRLLEEFDGAETWIDLPITETVWFGETNAIGGIADGKKELFFLQVGGTSAGFTGSARTLLPDNAREAQDAFKLLAATKAGGSVPSSEAARFMRTATPPAGKRAIVKTRGRSQAFAQTPTQVYIRAKGDRLLLVEHTGNFLSHEAGKGPGSALAWVAELHRLK